MSSSGNYSHLIVATPTKSVLYSSQFYVILYISEQNGALSMGVFPNAVPKRRSSVKTNRTYYIRRNAVMNQYIERVLNATKTKNANEPEFLQTVEEEIGRASCRERV